MSWPAARNPRQSRAFGLKLGSAAADSFSWAAPQVGRNSTSISPFTFPLWGFHSDVCDVLSLGIEMPSSGRQFGGWCPSCKNSGAAARDVSVLGGWPRDAPPHPFKVKLGDHFSAAPEITPGWRLAPGCGTHGTPLRCRSELVGLPRQKTTISATMQHSAVPRPRPSWNSRKRTLKDVKDVCALRLGGEHRSEIEL